MVGAEDAALGIDVLEQDERLVRDLDRVHQVEAALLPVPHERGGQLEEQGEQADVLGLHARERLGGFDRVLLGQLQRAQTRDRGHGQLHARLLDHQAGAHDLVRGLALVDPAQHLVRAGLQAEVDHLQPQLVQLVQLLLLFDQDGRG